MRGCLTLPFRLLLLALLIGAGILAYGYRDELRRRIHAWTAEPAGSAREGRADSGALGGARLKLAGLGRSRDSVVLTASELASLIAAEAARQTPGAVDSIQVRLGGRDDEVEVRGLVDTRSVRLGPASIVLRDREWVELAGRLAYRRVGMAEWTIERTRVRGLPVPRSVVERLLRQFSGTAPPGVVEIPVPASISGLRTARSGLVLYGGARRP